MSAKGEISIAGDEELVIAWDEYDDTVTVKTPSDRVAVSYAMARELRTALEFIFIDRWKR